MLFSEYNSYAYKKKKKTWCAFFIDFFYCHCMLCSLFLYVLVKLGIFFLYVDYKFVIYI